MLDNFDLYAILCLYANKIGTANIFFTDFCDYMQKYARHYLESQPELVCYLEEPQAAILNELHALENDGKVLAGSDSRGRRLIQIPAFYIDKLQKRYRNMEERPELPYPQATDVDSAIVDSITKQIHMGSSYIEYFDREKEMHGICKLLLSESVPAILVPADMPPENLIPYAIAKVRLFFLKNDFKDFVLKKVVMASPGKEISMSNFMQQLINKPEDAITGLKHSGEAFMFWTTTCNFAKQDILKKNELTPDEIFCIQSLMIIEYVNNYYKTKTQQNLQRETALRNLDLSLRKQPYYFSLDDIARFKDSRGVPLLGQYSNEDLQQYLKEKTTGGDITDIPALLPFQVASGKRYFVSKERVVTLIVTLCNESRKVIRTEIIDGWNSLLRNFSQEPAMKNQHDFELKLEALVAEKNPVLAALLTSSFLPLMAYAQSETDNTQVKLFNKGRLLPHSALLLLDRAELYTDARIILPFWYTIPILSTIISLLFGRKHTAHDKRKAPKQKQVVRTDQMIGESDEAVVDKKDAFRKAAATVEQKIVRSGSTLDKDLVFYMEKWNRSLNDAAKKNLEEDVNSLIRSYLRKTLRTMPAMSFNADRIMNLAESLADTPSLMKIKDHDALCAYIQCYMVKLVLKI